MPRPSPHPRYALAPAPPPSYPIEYMNNARIPCVGPHPKNVVLLACDAFGVLPPVSKLSLEQAMYHFISGYTAKVRMRVHRGAAPVHAWDASARS